MENASKALIIAGSILVTIMVISLGVMVFNNMSSTVKENANLDEQERNAFNSEILPYLGQNISGSQVNVLIQKVISIDNKALSTSDNVERVSIYKDSVADDNKIVQLKSGATAITYGTSRKVETGGTFYTVEGTYDSNGLITTIVVK